MLTHINTDPLAMGVKHHGEDYRRYRELWEQGKKMEYHGRVPLYISLDTVDDCNLACVMCHQRGRKRTKQVIDVHYVKRLFKEGREKGSCSVNIGALAEPLLAPEETVELLEYAHELGFMDIFLHSNLQLCDERLLERIVDSGVNHFCVSVDAWQHDTYEKVRCGGDYEVLMKNIRLLLDIRRRKDRDYPLLRVSAVPCRENREDLPGFVEFWSDYADIVEIQNYKETDKLKKSSRIAKRSVAGKGCNKMWMRVVLGTEGLIAPCSPKAGVESDSILGNYYDDNCTLEGFWNGEQARKLRAAHRSGALDDVPYCRKCRERTYVFDMEDED